jgi:hypothetical protein
VLDFHFLSPLAGRVVAIDQHQTTTDADGRFALEDVGPIYDLVIVEPDRSTVSLYEHLSRRDPLLVHEPPPGAVRVGTPSVYGVPAFFAPRPPQDPPVLLAPKNHALAESGMLFSWTPYAHGVHAIELHVWPSPKNPDIRIFTAATSTHWPDLRSLGVEFPHGAAQYGVWLAGIAAETMDDAVGPQGLGGRVRAAWVGASTGAEIVVPPERVRATRAAPPCDPAAAPVVCGKLKHPQLDRKYEWYQLSAMNLKLRCYPELAAAIRVSCVRDCAGARAFFKAYEMYSHDHPGFDANQPLECPPTP